jgi:uncharacterized protein Smg (DUF494 family)
MISRLMDLVLLLAEMNERDAGSVKDIGKELSLRGYTPEEVNQAMSWISSSKTASSTCVRGVSKSSSQRVLTSWERTCLGEEGQRYLLRLLNLGIIDNCQLDRILIRIAPFSMERTDLDEVKLIACSIIFNAPAYDLDDQELKEMDENRDIN